MRSSFPTVLTLAILLLAGLASLPVATAAPTVTEVKTCPSYSATQCQGAPSGSENGGTVLSISGGGFEAGALVCMDNLVANACPSGRAATQVDVKSGTEIRAVTPPRENVQANTPTNVVIRNQDGQLTTVTNGFIYTNVSAPDVTSVSPSSGSSNGGTLVTIKGTKFDPSARPAVCFGTITVPAAAVDPCGNAADSPVVTVTDSTTLTAVTPAGTASLGAVGVSVVYTSGSDTLANGFLYVAAAQPGLTSVSPTSGGTNGGVRVTLTGSGFASGATVAFGGVAGTQVIFTSPTSLSVLTPAKASAGAVDVRVENPDGQSRVLASGFAYSTSPAPTITGMAPSAGPSVGGEIIGLSGTNFAPGAVLCATNPAPACPAPILPIGPPAPDAAFFALPAAADDQVFYLLNPDGQKVATPTFDYRDAFFLTSISPSSGPVIGGGTVTIDDGLNNRFSCGADGIPTVLFGTVEAHSVTPAGCSDTLATSLSVVPPAHAAGTVDVTVINPTGKAAVFQNGFTFNGVANPAFADSNPVAPQSGSANGGTTVTLTGVNFPCSAGGPKPIVRFGGTPADPDDVAVSGCTGDLGTTITVITPPHVGSATAVTVEVVASPGKTATKTSGFTYNAAAPDIAGVNSCDGLTCTGDGSGSANGGTEVRITGANFVCGPTPKESSTVKVGGTLAEITDCQSALLDIITPGGSAGAKTVEVENPSKEKDSLSNGFTYETASAPTISSVSPASGTSLGGENIVVSGSNFACGNMPKPVVQFGGKTAPPADVTCTSSESLTVKTPPNPVSSTPVDVKVTNPSGQSATKAGAYSYSTASAPPQITSVTPNQGTSLGGTDVTIAGSGFFCDDLSPNATVILFFAASSQVAVPADDVTCAPGTITFTTPKHASGLAAVIVRNPDNLQGSISGGFRYLPELPTLSGMTPASGSVLGGPLSILGGTGTFRVGAAVLVEGTASPAVAVNQDQAPCDPPVCVKMPPGTAGLADVTYIDPDGQSVTRANAYTYTSVDPPTATSITGPSNSAPQGSVIGGTAFTVKGANFGGAGSVVCFGPVTGTPSTCPAEAKATDVAGTATELTGKTPPHSLGTADVTVINPDGQASPPLRQAYTFLGLDQLPVPTIGSVSPTTGPADGGTTVTITGTNLAGGNVTFGGVDGTEVTSTATTITAKTPAHAAGKVDVVVTVAGQSVTKEDGFEYTGTATTPPPTTTTQPPTTTTTPSPTIPPGGLTPAAIKAANDRIEVTVTREGDNNIVAWTLPTTGVPAAVQGVQVWVSNSPYVLVEALSANSQGFRDGKLTHTPDDDPPAQADSRYLVTMFYGSTEALGFFTASTAPDTAVYPGTSSEGAGGGGGGDGGLPTWAIVLILIGVLFLVVLAAILIARGRNRESGAVAQQGYAWEETSEDKAADAEWQGGGPPTEVHQARCPACATSFTATGAKPIVTVCPGCGKKGILR